MYGRESWTLEKADEERIDASEMKELRQISRMSWTDEWVLKKAGLIRDLLRAVKNKLSYALSYKLS